MDTNSVCSQFGIWQTILGGGCCLLHHSFYIFPRITFFMWLLGPVMIQQRSLGWGRGWAPGRARELSSELESRVAGDCSRVARSAYSGITYISVLNRNPSRNPAITGSKDLSISRPPSFNIHQMVLRKPFSFSLSPSLTSPAFSLTTSFYIFHQPGNIISYIAYLSIMNDRI